MTEQTQKLHEKEIRRVYSETLLELVEEGMDIVVMEADLARTNGTDHFEKHCPERYIDVGIAECNMISMAAGLASMGKIPFASSFGAFSGRRVTDQIFMAVSYSNLNIKIIGSDPGVTGEVNGASHQSYEDTALMRPLPNMTILDPADAYELREAVKEAAKWKGACYIRLLRKVLPPVFDSSYKMEIGKGQILRDGKDASIISAGFILPQALAAAEELEKEGKSVRVVNMPTIKPLDKKLVLESAQKTSAVVVAENGTIAGGLGGAVCEFLSGTFPVPVRRIGMPGLIGEVGKADFLMKKFGMTKDDIKREVMKSIEMKRA